MADNKINYKDVLKESDYRKLLISTVINRFGDALDAVGFTWLVYQITHSGTWSAIIFALNILPNVIIQPFTGALVERLDKKKEHELKLKEEQLSLVRFYLAADLMAQLSNLEFKSFMAS